jgi:hypothetical protein
MRKHGGVADFGIAALGAGAMDVHIVVLAGNPDLTVGFRYRARAWTAGTKLWRSIATDRRRPIEWK